MRRPPNYPLCLLLLFTLLVRGGVLLLVPHALAADPDGYRRLAETLVACQTFGNSLSPLPLGEGPGVRAAKNAAELDRPTSLPRPNPHPSPLPEGRGDRAILPSPFGRGAGGEGSSSPLPLGEGPGVRVRSSPLPLGEGPGVRVRPSPLPLGEGPGVRVQVPPLSLWERGRG